MKWFLKFQLDWIKMLKEKIRPSIAPSVACHGLVLLELIGTKNSLVCVLNGMLFCILCCNDFFSIINIEKFDQISSSTLWINVNQCFENGKMYINKIAEFRFHFYRPQAKERELHNRYALNMEDEKPKR